MSRAESAPVSDVQGFVLAGGRSTRMGQDKALASFLGRPLICNALNILREAGIAGAIAGGSAALVEFAAVVPDQPGARNPATTRGPLAGICSAIAATSAHHIVLLPVDLPLLASSLLAFLVQYSLATGSCITLCSVNGYTQTFPAVLDRGVLPGLEACLESGKGGCFAAFQSVSQALNLQLSPLPVEMLVQTGQVTHPALLAVPLWFLNVNDPHDLSRAGKVAGGLSR